MLNMLILSRHMIHEFISFRVPYHVIHDIFMMNGNHLYTFSKTSLWIMLFLPPLLFYLSKSSQLFTTCTVVLSLTVDCWQVSRIEWTLTPTRNPRRTSRLYSDEPAAGRLSLSAAQRISTTSTRHSYVSRPYCHWPCTYKLLINYVVLRVFYAFLVSSKTQHLSS